MSRSEPNKEKIGKGRGQIEESNDELTELVLIIITRLHTPLLSEINGLTVPTMNKKKGKKSNQATKEKEITIPPGRICPYRQTPGNKGKKENKTTHFYDRRIHKKKEKESKESTKERRNQ